MAKRQQGKHEEVLLIPFLDILCSLIGILILIIVVLSVAQLQRVNGRKPEEVALSQKLQKLIKEKPPLVRNEAELNKRLKELEKLSAEIETARKKVEELKKRLSNSSEEVAKNRAELEALKKRIAELKQQLEQTEKELATLKEERDKLLAEIEARKKKLEFREPPIVVRQIGSGFSSRSTFFVLADASGITILKDGQKKLVPMAEIQNSPELASHLQVIKSTLGGNLVFLIRKDGAKSYELGAGLAESRYNIPTAKLPLPGQGEVDISQFGTR
jgi:uncharacterized protein YlxW (UPF0749 family)